MKSTVLILLFTTIFLASFSQEKSGFIGIQSGLSIPVGKYYEKKLDQPAGSFATTGFNVSIEGAWFFKPWLGVGGQFGMDFQPVDVGSLGWEKVIADEFLDSVYIRSDPFRNYTLYAGLYFEKPIVKRLSVTAKALGGVMLSYTPYQLYKANFFMIGEKWYEITSAGDIEGSFLAGAGLKYSLKNCIGFTLNGEFTYNKCDYDFTTSTGNIRTDERVISFVNILLGVFVKL
jgi:hypothetical protein